MVRKSLSRPSVAERDNQMRNAVSQGCDRVILAPGRVYSRSGRDFVFVCGPRQVFRQEVGDKLAEHGYSPLTSGDHVMLAKRGNSLYLTDCGTVAKTVRIKSAIVFGHHNAKLAAFAWPATPANGRNFNALRHAAGVNITDHTLPNIVKLFAPINDGVPGVTQRVGSTSLRFSFHAFPEPNQRQRGDTVYPDWMPARNPSEKSGTIPQVMCAVIDEHFRRQ